MRMQAWNLVYLVGLIVYIGIRGVFGGRTKRNEKVLSRVDLADRALVGLVFVGSIVLPRNISSRPGLGSLIIVCRHLFHGAGQ